MTDKIKLKLKIMICVIQCLILCFGLISVDVPDIAIAAPKTFRLSQAKNLALATSSSYRRIKNKIELKKVSYNQAVTSLKLKKKNMSTFRWTPLLSFKFPEKADLMDEFEYVYKPTQIQSEITELKHQLSDTVFSVYEETSNLYTKIYGYQEQIAFEEEQLKGLKDSLEKNMNRVLLGLATESDVEMLEGDIKNVETSLSSKIKEYENAKKELSDLTGIDVTSNYVFANPYLDSKIPRDQMDSIIQYTLDNNHELYSAKMATALGLMSLDVNYDLMKKQYGSHMSIISSYIQQVKNGEKIDGTLFKASYEEFLKAIDKRWQGKKKILFIKIPKEWFKGAIDGVRYIEDEPYGLYEAALEYQELLADEQDVAKDIEKQVTDSYETLAKARTSYINLREDVEKEKERVNKNLLLNSLGECTFKEYTDSKKALEELQVQELEALELYSELLYSYDRLTCGFISDYLSGQDMNLQGTAGGNSYIVEEETEVAMYYICPIIEENMFEFGIYIPDDFETEITHYELWADNYQIGTRTEVDKTIRHLMLTMEEIEAFSIRVYTEEEFVDECVIDTQVYQDELKIIVGYTVKENENRTPIGTYDIKIKESTSMSDISLQFKPEEGIEYYKLTDTRGKDILTAKPRKVTESFEYLYFIAVKMDNVVIKCYDKDQKYMYDAYFEPTDFSMYKKD